MGKEGLIGSLLLIELPGTRRDGVLATKDLNSYVDASGWFATCLLEEMPHRSQGKETERTSQPQESRVLAEGKNLLKGISQEGWGSWLYGLEREQLSQLWVWSGPRGLDWGQRECLIL